jgi:hypothetical protein
MAENKDTPSILPDDYAAAIGRVAQTWARFEFEIDLGIWRLTGTHQQLAACVTAQLSSYVQKLNAFIALAQVRGASTKSVTKLNKFFDVPALWASFATVLFTTHA